MAASVSRDPGRLGIFFLLLLTLAAVLTVFLIDFSCGSEDSAHSDEAIVSEASTPEITNLDGDSAGGGGSATAGAGAMPGSAPAGAPVSLTETPSPVFLTAGTGGTGTGSTPGGPVPVPAPPAPKPGSIAGTVFGDGGPAGGITVMLFTAAGTPAGMQTTTLGDGTFQFQVAPGQYKLFFSDPSGFYEPAWYGGYGPGSAAVVMVAVDQETAIAQTLSKSTAPGGIAGTVRGPGGKGLAGISVFAFLYQDLECDLTSCPGKIELKGSAMTDDRGEYSVNGLEAGSYKILFSPLGTELTLQWYRDQSTHETAKTVSVGPGRITEGIDANLYAGGTISGTITRDGGAPAAYALVDIYDQAGIIVYSGLTDTTGRYRSSRLPEGVYRVHAATYVSGSWTDEWYSDKKDFASANPVSVTRDSDTGGINIEINARDSKPPGGIIIKPPTMNVDAAAAAQVAVDEEPATTQPPEDTVSGDSGMPLEEGADISLPTDEDQQDVVVDGGDDQPALGEVERDEASAV